MKRLHTILPVGLAAAFLVAGSACKDDESSEPEVAESTAPPPRSEPDVQHLSDADIEKAVERELSYDEMVADDDVGVTVLKGVVELTGSVPYLLAKKRATRIATAVRGVRAVTNQIEVKPVERTDAQIAKDIEQELRTDPATESYQVTPEVEDGVVTLKGKVDSWQEKALAERLAEYVKGVKAVNNEIEFQYQEDRPDPEIRADVESRLRWDVLVDDAPIAVAVDKGLVTLTGTVGSVAERRRAEDDAYVVGAKLVDVSGLEVKWWAKDRNLRETRSVTKSPEAIRKAILAAAFYDPRVESRNVDPVVVGDVVTLRGKVDTLKAKKVAERIARNTVGVHRVIDDLEVHPPTPIADAELERRIERGLFLDPITEAFEIEVSVHKGDVELTGKVDRYFEKAEATDVAMRYVGDGKITNQLEVEKPAGRALVIDRRLYPEAPDVISWSIYVPSKATIEDAAIKAHIEESLLWDPDVDSDQVDVRVKDGKVTLSGTVDTWLERIAAESIAFEAGATSVDDELEVS